jgi:hypothetical protein
MQFPQYPTILKNQNGVKKLLSLARVWDNSSNESQFKHEKALV